MTFYFQKKNCSVKANQNCFYLRDKNCFSRTIRSQIRNILTLSAIETLGISHLDEVYACRSFARKETNVKVKLGNGV